MLLGMVAVQAADIALLVAVASAGNILGAMVNWWLGKYILHFKDKKWFPVKDKQLSKAQDIYGKWGVWSLLLAWVPFIGDPLTFIAGMMRTNIWLFLLLVSVGKIGRYIVVAGAAASVL